MSIFDTEVRHEIDTIQHKHSVDINLVDIIIGSIIISCFIIIILIIKKLIKKYL